MKLNILFFILINFLSCLAFARLKVYAADGVTVLGYYVGCAATTCDGTGQGWSYANTSTGAISIIPKTTSSDGCLNGTVYYNSVTCAVGNAVSSSAQTGTCICDGTNCFTPSNTVPCATADSQTNGVCSAITSGGYGYGCGLTQRTYLCGIGNCIIK